MEIIILNLRSVNPSRADALGASWRRHHKLIFVLLSVEKVNIDQFTWVKTRKTHLCLDLMSIKSHYFFTKNLFACWFNFLAPTMGTNCPRYTPELTEFLFLGSSYGNDPGLCWIRLSCGTADSSISIWRRSTSLAEICSCMFNCWMLCIWNSSVILV